MTESLKQSGTKRAWRRIRVTGNWLPDHAFVWAYWNGTMWNGFAVPMFTSQDASNLCAVMPSLVYVEARQAFLSKRAERQNGSMRHRNLWTASCCNSIPLAKAGVDNSLTYRRWQSNQASPQSRLTLPTLLDLPRLRHTDPSGCIAGHLLSPLRASYPWACWPAFR
ncbi:hypothetical protein CBM2634_U610001 [Cupriavidus taiwanensis]|uniref:Uncharacterized protein n=1 Tax=Cupriavidus taiwanensis TaxID=164546 RepID=A0A375JCY4_9BURK|nr:hypothetical protein CBM2634_U610001 [Cupriavidus taiwanensis]